MKSVEFCYWLQGMFELSNPQEIGPIQTDLIKKHLAMVFVHEIDPSYPMQQQTDLNKLHVGTPQTQIGGVAADGTIFRC